MLARHFGSRLVTRAEAEYDVARRVWNGAIDRYPALIGRCTSADDVARLIGFAVDHDVPVAVRGGGHSVAGFGTCDGGVVIDLSPMSHVVVDATTRTVRVGGGATWGVFDAEAHRFGLATTGGQVSTTGVGGLTLGGGIGWLMRKHGLTCDNVVRMSVVTADGRRVDASADENPELFWALRGGGGNFGVVTEFEFRLHPVKKVLAGVVLHPLERAGEVLAFFRDYAATAPDEVGPFVGFWTPLPSVALPASLRGRPVVAIGACYAGPMEAAERVLAPLRAFGRPPYDDFAGMTYPALQQMLDGGAPRGMHNYARAEYLDQLSDEAVDVIAGAGGRFTSPLSQLFVAALGGQVARVPDEATAFGHRDAPFVVNALAIWESGDAAPHARWAQTVWSDVAPWSAGGTYVNFLADEGEARVRNAYGSEKFARLARVKRTFDPDNLFRINQNIRPAAHQCAARGT